MATISEALAVAVQHHQAGRLQAAERIYRQILAVEPNHAVAIHLLGVMASQLGRTAEAASCYRRAVELNPAFAEAHNNLGNALKEQGRPEEAMACYRRALELKPDFVEPYNNLGALLKEQGKLDEAVACYRRALELRPDFPATHNNLGNALKDQDKLDEAVACYRRALELTPDFAEARYNLANALKDQDKLDEAVACYRRVLELKPDYAEAHNNLGNTLRDQGKPDEAAACARRALQWKPDLVEAHYNLGTALKDQGKLDEALACYHRALELKPDYTEAHLSRALTFFLAGDWQQGWSEYQWRWQTKDFIPRHFSQPLWNGEPLAGKTILLHAEQGLGDTIQFVRYAPIVRQCGATVIVECQQPLLGLLEGCPGMDRLIGKGDDLPAFDVHAPLLSVPGILKTTLENVAATIPYLFPKPALIEQWRQRLMGLAGIKIGIAWQGNPKYRGDRFRSIPLRDFAPLAQVPGVRLISLQKGLGTEQLAEVRNRFPVTELGSRLQDFMDTAAVIRSLDLVIACDTAVAHLAGALGADVWVALPLAPDWRWLLDRSDSPWYPTMRLFRQRERGNWQGVFEQIAKALSAALRAR
jgi:tetratricopeptide (TPR) repeat protein